MKASSIFLLPVMVAVSAVCVAAPPPLFTPDRWTGVHPEVSLSSTTVRCSRAHVRHHYPCPSDPRPCRSQSNAETPPRPLWGAADTRRTLWCARFRIRGRAPATTELVAFDSVRKLIGAGRFRAQPAPSRHRHAADRAQCHGYSGVSSSTSEGGSAKVE